MLLTQKVRTAAADHDLPRIRCACICATRLPRQYSSAHALLSSHMLRLPEHFHNETYIIDEAGGGLPCTPLSQGDIRGEAWHNLYCLRRLLLGQLGQRGRVLV